MMYVEDFKKYVPNLPDIDMDDVKEYFLKKEKSELVRLGIIAGVAGALTVTTAIIISKKLRKKKKVQVIEVTADENLKEE